MVASILRVMTLPPPPQQNRPNARTFNITMKEAVQNPSVVTLLVNFLDAKVLIDSGAKKSFIYEEFINKLYCEIQRLGERLITKLANDDQVPMDRVCPRCDIVIAGHHFSVDWIPFKLGEFDVMLGINCLDGNNAQIDCTNKKVNLRTTKNATIIFKGEKQKQRFLTMMQTKQLLHQGYKAYLPCVLDVSKKGPRIEDIPVVCEFHDVFPDELPGLSPD
ncbi:uncharacterized protein LOC141694314 [Apium graveolens]|uniref:uncharacterized protein LOC141694314 n=1 Tax=Apium graveolens TaxID=4045 RepID=UPI003D78F70E